MNNANQGIDFSAIRDANPIADTINRYIELTRRGGEYVARCPFHNDSRPSFYVVPSKAKAFCMSCGWHGDVIDFVAEFEKVETADAVRRLNGGDLPVDRPTLPALPPDEAGDWTPIMPAPADAPPMDLASIWNPRRGQVVNWKRIATRADAYRSADGGILGYVVRLEIDGSKLTPTVTFCRHRDGRTAWASVKFPNPRPLQGQDDLARRPEAVALVVSGEKCQADAARYLPGFAAVTWPGGDQNVLRADWRPLHGRRVTIWPDADASGMEAAQRLAAALYGHAAEIRIVDPTGQPEGWDIADGVAEGMDTAALRQWASARVRAWSPDGQPYPEKKTAPCDEAVKVEPAREEPAPPGEGSSVTGVNHTPSVAGSATAAIPLDMTNGGQLATVHYLPAAKITAELEDTLDPQEDDLPELYSEDNAALAFSRLFADDLRYVAPWGRWMTWRDQRWVHEDTLEVFDMARKVARSIAAQARTDPALHPKQQAAVSARYGQAGTIAAIERLARADRRHAATIEQWDADIWLLNTPAGVVDLRTGAIRPGDRGAHMTKITAVAPGGDCPTWLRFLDTATAGDTELIGFLQRMAGYALTGSTRDHALFFVYGTGGNGKGTFLNTLQWILGDYARSAPADMFTERKHEAHTTELARLMGARLVAAQETEEGKRWAEAKIKALTGGDPITARFMRQDDFEYIPQFKLVMTGNHKPGLRNVDEAIKRRLHLIPFTVTIPAERRDTGLGERLRAEAGGILSWCIEGCRQWQERGLAAPAAVLAATSEYLEQQDTLAAWLEECVEVTDLGSAKSSALYASYKSWAERSSEFVLPLKRWVAAMEGRGYTSVKTGGSMVYKGIKVIQQRDDWSNDGYTQKW